MPDVEDDEEPKPVQPSVLPQPKKEEEKVEINNVAAKSVLGAKIKKGAKFVGTCICCIIILVGYGIYQLYKDFHGSETW